MRTCESCEAGSPAAKPNRTWRRTMCFLKLNGERTLVGTRGPEKGVVRDSPVKPTGYSSQSELAESIDSLGRARSKLLLSIDSPHNGMKLAWC